MNIIYDDEQLHRMLSESDKEMPFEDFEENVMIEIHKESERKRSIMNNIKLSWFFFSIGFASGIILTLFLYRMEDPVLGVDLEKIIIPILLLLSLVYLLLIEKLIKISFLQNQ